MNTNNNRHSGQCTTSSNGTKPKPSIKQKQQPLRTRSQRKKQKTETQGDKSSNNQQIDKITHNLKQTEQALRDFKNNFQNISSSKTHLVTAESSTASLPFITRSNSNLKNFNSNSTTNELVKCQDPFQSLSATSAQDDKHSYDQRQYKQPLNDNKYMKQCSPIRDDIDSDDDNEKSNYSFNRDIHESFNPSVCSGQEIATQESNTQRFKEEVFDYDKYLNNHDKENHQPNTSTTSQPKKKLTGQSSAPSQISESFRVYLENMHSNNSQAIAGAMKALQKKINSLESENNILKDCFSGIQKKCVDMEKSHKQEIQAAYMSQQQYLSTNGQSTTRSEVLLTEIELLHQQVNDLKNNQQSKEQMKLRYKDKVKQLQQQLQEQQDRNDSSQEKFHQQRQEYQNERQALVSQLRSLEVQNSELIKEKQEQEQQIKALTKEANDLKNDQSNKLKKYKRCIHELRKELKMLERSHMVSQKALTHTEHFVDEVVYVNEQLVQSLSKSKTKLRSMSCSRGRNRSYVNLIEGTNEKVSRYNSRNTLARERPPLCHSASMTPHNHQTKQFTQFQHQDDTRDSINRTEEPRRNNIKNYQNVVSIQTTVQKPPKSNRQKQRFFSFSKGNNHDRNQQRDLQNINHKFTLQHQPSQQNMLETSRFQDEESSLMTHNLSNDNINSHQNLNICEKRGMSRYASNEILIRDDFTLHPYEKQINSVSTKIAIIEKDLKSIGLDARDNVSNKEDYLQFKQSQLLDLRNEHKELVKSIRKRQSRSVSKH